MRPRKIVAQQQEEPGSNSGGVQDSDGVQDYTFVHDREPRCITPPVRCEFEDLATYALLTNSGDPSTFREAMAIQEKER